MIIFGTRGVTSTQSTGDFFCPNCNARQSYAHKRVRTYFTLYFIPLIPLDVVAEFIECQVCKGTFREDALRYDPRAHQAEFVAAFDQAVLRIMCMMALAGDEPAEDARERVRESFGQLFGRELDSMQVEEEFGKARAEILNPAQLLARMDGGLTDQGKDLAIRAVLSAVSPAAAATQAQSEILEQMAVGLCLSDAHLRGILAQHAESRGT